MSSYYHMIDVSDKVSTKRIAIARGKIIVGEAVFNLIRNNQMIKGDPLRLAEVAAIMGAKNTSALIPLCHPLGLDKVEFMTELVAEEFAVQVYCIAITSAKTGVEMEALSGVSAGLLTIYDLSKISEPSLTIGEIQLMVKIGGKSGVWFNPQISSFPDWINDYIQKQPQIEGVKFATITLSDRASNGIYEDKSGKLLQQLLINAQGVSIGYELIADEKELLTSKINQLLQQDKHLRPQLIITSGGTGVGQRDIAPETILALGGREINGVGELLRLYGSKFTPYSWSSRSLASSIDGCIIIALPGSSNAVREGVECLLPILGHLVKMVAGGNHD